MSSRGGRIEKFGFPEQFPLNKKYCIVNKLGSGWEGEVYIIKERVTGIERAAKFFYPHRNEGNRTLRFYAKKLHKLNNCPTLIQYVTQESIKYRDHDVNFLISELVEGEQLTEFMKRQPGKRLGPFQALHLLYALASGLKAVHRQGEYHGDLHSDNIIVRRYGLSFDLKFIDMYHWGQASPQNIRDDVYEMIRIFYDCLGGQKYYSRLSKEVKDICCGLRKATIAKKFKNAGQLVDYLENMQWS